MKIKEGFVTLNSRGHTGKSQELRDEKMGRPTDGEYNICKEITKEPRAYYNMMGINMGTGNTDAYSDWIHSCVGEVVLG